MKAMTQQERKDLVSAARRLNALTQQSLQAGNTRLAGKLAKEEVAVMIALLMIDNAKLIESK